MFARWLAGAIAELFPLLTWAQSSRQATDA